MYDCSTTARAYTVSVSKDEREAFSSRQKRLALHRARFLASPPHHNYHIWTEVCNGELIFNSEANLPPLESLVHFLLFHTSFKFLAQSSCPQFVRRQNFHRHSLETKL